MIAVGGGTIGAIVLRPGRVPEWIWSLAGAAVAVLLGLVPMQGALHALGAGTNVYCFLAGMLAIAQLAKIHGVFDWLAARAVHAARGSGHALFGLFFLSGILVTALLSNDGTIVLLTPAVLAAVREADADPRPYLYACAFVANAAGFALPISNPANLVVFQTLPTLLPWLHWFGLASIASVLCTYLLLTVVFRRTIGRPIKCELHDRRLSSRGVLSFALTAFSAAVLVAAAALGRPIGFTALALAVVDAAVLIALDRSVAVALARKTSWSIIPLVAGLFVLLQGLSRSGVLASAATFLHWCAQLGWAKGDVLTGYAVTLADNLLNNLPTALLARGTIAADHVPARIVHAALVGVDLGPNLFVTGSLATLLWLIILRKERITIRPLDFLRTGAIVGLPALAAALLLVR